MNIGIDIISLLLIAAGLAMDAFSVSLTIGMSLKKPTVQDSLKPGMMFGLFQFLMPCIGWGLASIFSGYIQKFDHWIAFILLSFIGGKILIEALSDGKKEDSEPAKYKNMLSLHTLLLLAVATSIDALAVGVTFSAMRVAVLPAAAVIGIVALIFSSAGVFIGHRSGSLLGNKAEIIGGIILIAIGLKILIGDLFF